MVDQTKPTPSWSSFASWRAPHKEVSWSAAQEWGTAHRRAMRALAAPLMDVLRESDAQLKDIGCDPLREDWSRFRPLRLSREEDWSDWLAFLLEDSRTGRFGARLLANNVQRAADWIVREAQREVFAKPYRADIVTFFRNDEWAHIEVKVGDRELEKTVATGNRLRDWIGSPQRKDVLLLPSADLGLWDDA